MTRDDVLRMAEESGFGRLLPARGSLPACWHRLKQFADAAYAAGQAAEREACKAAQLETIALPEELAKRDMKAEKEAYQRGVRDEREACASLCKMIGNPYSGERQENLLFYADSGLGCAAAIRARNNKDDQQ